MRVMPLIASVLFLSQATPVLASDCEGATAKIVGETGAVIERRSPIEKNFFLIHPSAAEIVIYCSDASPHYASFSFDRNMPPPRFYEFVSVAMRAFGYDSGMTAKASIACVKAALTDKNERAERMVNGGTLECRAFTRDGGGYLLSFAKRRGAK